MCFNWSVVASANIRFTGRLSSSVKEKSKQKSQRQCGKKWLRIFFSLVTWFKFFCFILIITIFYKHYNFYPKTITIATFIIEQSFKGNHLKHQTWKYKYQLLPPSHTVHDDVPLPELFVIDHHQGQPDHSSFAEEHHQSRVAKKLNHISGTQVVVGRHRYPTTRHHHQPAAATVDKQCLHISTDAVDGWAKRLSVFPGL